MCRLCAITAHFSVPDVRNTLLDRMMLLSAAEGQKSGWGVCDGKSIHKGTGLYGQDSEWLTPKSEFTGNIAVGHVRLASVGMGLRRAESHPYSMRGFVFLHNGQFYGTANKLWDDDDPDTNSWRAAQIYEARYGSEVNVANVNEWLGNFWQGTAYACMWLKKDVIYISRNVLRDLFYVTIPQQAGIEAPGFMVNTSERVLTGACNYLKTMYNVETSNVAPFAAKALYKIEYGSDRAEVSALNYTLQPVPKLWKIKNTIYQRTGWIEKPRS